MKFQILFSQKNKKKIFKYVVFWKFYPELIQSTSRHRVPSFYYDRPETALSEIPLPWNPS